LEERAPPLPEEPPPIPSSSTAVKEAEARNEVDKSSGNNKHAEVGSPLTHCVMQHICIIAKACSSLSLMAPASSSGEPSQGEPALPAIPQGRLAVIKRWLFCHRMVAASPKGRSLTSSTAKRETGKSAKKTSTEKRTGIETVVAEKTDTGISMIRMITMTGGTGRGNGIANRYFFFGAASCHWDVQSVCRQTYITGL